MVKPDNVSVIESLASDDVVFEVMS